MPDFTPELGQIAFSNGAHHHVATPAYITAGFEIIAAAVQEARGIDPDREWPLTANSGAEPWESEVFSMRAYCWCDGGIRSHEDGCPPNFEHHASGFKASWYKHAERGQSCLTPIPTATEWGRIVATCIQATAAREGQTETNEGASK